MTLEEAIKHEEEIVKEEQYEYQECVATHNTEGAMNCRKYAEEHRQLAKWLKDYKRLLEQEPCEDAINRQAVLDCLTATGLKKYDFILNARDKIKNLPPVKPQEPILDKIRAEIEQNAYPIVHGVNNHEKGMTLYGILQVIDKYKAESEPKESEDEEQEECGDCVYCESLDGDCCRLIYEEKEYK